MCWSLEFKCLSFDSVVGAAYSSLFYEQKRLAFIYCADAELFDFISKRFLSMSMDSISFSFCFAVTILSQVM